MESLLCDEDWLRSPPSHERKLESSIDLFYTTREDCENALMVCLQKDVSYMPEAGYTHRLQSSHLFYARIRAIQWFIKSRRRLNLSFKTVFDAANHLDRFISMNHCSKWKYWMIELLSVSCLSIAVKFGEVSIPPLHELQLEDLDGSFQSSTIQQMELTVLKALGWRVGSITPYSYLELLMGHLDSLQPHLRCNITSRVTELLLGTLSDPKFLEFRPCTVTVSALRCSLEELFPSKCDANLSNLINLIPDQTDNINSCHKIMEERVADPLYSLIAYGHSYCPSSPLTVITMERNDIYDCYIDLSLFKVSGSNENFPSNPKKRKREEDTLSNITNSVTIGVTFRDPSMSQCP